MVWLAAGKTTLVEVVTLVRAVLVTVPRTSPFPWVTVPPMVKFVMLSRSVRITFPVQVTDCAFTSGCIETVPALHTAPLMVTPESS
jgi:hypothetical protein